MMNKFEKIFEQLADFHMLAGYDGWMIGACVYEQRKMAGERVSSTEFGCENDLTVVQNQKIKNQNSCKSEIVKKTSSFAVMRNQLELQGMHYQLELHVVKPEAQEIDTSRQAGIEENVSKNNIEKMEMQRIDACDQNKMQKNMDTGVEELITFTHPDILRFVDAVGDTNSIHRTAHAVVPGLLMVEWMLDVWMKKQPETQAVVQTETKNETQTDMQNSREFKCRFRFEKPVFVDEKLQVQARTEHGKQIYECKREDKEIVWNMRIS